MTDGTPKLVGLQILRFWMVQDGILVQRIAWLSQSHDDTLQSMRHWMPSRHADNGHVEALAYVMRHWKSPTNDKIRISAYATWTQADQYQFVVLSNAAEPVGPSITSGCIKCHSRHER